MKYDSILFGNGLTIAILKKIGDSVKLSERERRCCYLNNFMYELLSAPIFSPEYRRFLKFLNPNYIKLAEQHKEVKNALNPYIDDILNLGFERWAGKYVLDEINGVLKKYFDYLYVIYNYWYRELENNVLQKTDVKLIIEQIITQLESQGDTFFTTNFDLLIDNPHVSNPLTVEHIHGRFVSPYTKYDQVLAFYIDPKTFLYTYLYGTTGYEKMSSLGNIHQQQYPSYDLGFFYDHYSCLGNLLIYGISFSFSNIVDDTFYSEYSEHDKDYMLRSVDGHIIYRLKILVDKGLVNSITIAVYDWEQEITRYQSLFSDPVFDHKIKFLKSTEALSLS